ncbi:uncharacterized protein LOC117110801 [Anneissia japonica]|uniref:uncharacterized protein LOC117110801 n=1 Tax=Anneissia japonica TaxID=1529436 RepID=UPI0014256B92|nr:uncharacterized protein LOC117110801 [Anneissia japonica]
MSLATSYRFETQTEKTSLKRALNRQKERIKYDELIVARESIVKNEKKVNEQAEWSEGLETASGSGRVREDLVRMNHETFMTGKALVAVRRKALQTLLQKEYDMYETELQQQGKAFYFKRE